MDPASAVSPAHSARARSLTKELRPPPGNLSAMVGMSAAEGVMAGAAINADLVAEDARGAVRGRGALVG